MTELSSLKVGDFVEFVDRPVLAAPMPKLWYMLRLHANCDLRCERQLLERGVSAYVPKEVVSVKTGWNRYRRQMRAIFPGAMFVPDFDADLSRLKSLADGIGGFVRFGNEPLKVSLISMDWIRRFETVMQAEAPKRRKFERGETVRITKGPWMFFEGKIARLDRKHRIVVLIAFLSREVPVELNEDQVELVTELRAGTAPNQAKRPAHGMSRKIPRLAC